MERIKLSSLVRLAKHIAGDQAIYRPGMEMKYSLNSNDFELLERELHEFNGQLEYESSKHKFVFDVMDISFEFTRIT